MDYIHKRRGVEVLHDEIIYISGEQNTLSFRWQQFKRVVLEEDIYMLELREGGRTLLIPRHALGEEKFLMDELIRTVCGKYKLPLDTTY